MSVRKDILSVAVALALAAAPVFASNPQTSTPAASKDKTTAKAKDHVLQGSVVSSSGDTLTVRTGKKDMIFKIDPSAPKPSSMAPGSEIAVTYREEGKQHVATSIEPAAVKAPSTKSHK